MGVIIDIASLPLDNTIQLVPSVGGDPEYYAADNGIISTEFYELGNRVVFKRNDRSFAWTPDSMRYVDENGMEDIIYTVQDVPLETKANYARFNRAMPDVDDWFNVSNDRLKHTILLQGFQRDPLPWLSGDIDFVFGGRIEFDADLRILAHGLVITGAFETSEGIQIIDPDGNVLFDLPQIVAYDSGIPERAMTTGKYRVNSNDSGVLAFDIVVDNAWISSLERVYPIVIDPTVVVASAYSTAGNGGKKLAGPLTNGWLVCSVLDGAGTTIYVYKSADNGTTWSQLCSIGTIANPPSICAFGNRVTVAMGNAAGTLIYSVTFDASTVTNIDLTSTKVTVDTQTLTSGNIPPIAVSATGVMTMAWSSKNATFPNSYNIRSAKSADGGVTWTKQDGTAGIDQITGNNTAGLDNLNPCIIYRSTNNPVIVFNYVQSTANIIYSITYSGSAWPGSLVQIVNGGTFVQTSPCGIIKQNGSNVGRIWTLWQGLDATDTTKQNVRASWSDDGGATWGTAFKLTSGNTLDRKLPTVSEYTNGDIYVFYQDSTAISYQICLNGATTFGSTTTFATTGTNPSAEERAANTIIGVVFMDASQVKFDKLSFNVAPNAPTLTTQPNFDATVTQTMAWTFSDPDVGNTQSAYQLFIIKVSDGSTALDTGKVVSSTASKSLTGSTLTNANQYQWKVRTWDNSDVVGPYSSLGSFYASAKPTTTITVPVSDGTTVATSTLTANWTYSDPESEASSAYQVRITDNSDVQLYTTGKVTATSVLALTIAYTLANSTNYKVKITTWDAKDIASTEVVRTFVTSFTVPATPTLTATVQTGYIAIAITNPTPVGAQPAITGNDLYRRTTGTTAYIRIATGLANNGTYNDYAAASGISYDYYVQANGNNNTSANSAVAARSLTLHCVYLHDVVNPSGTIYRFKLDGKGRTASYTPDVTMLQFVGRTRPVAQFGESGQGKISVQLDMMQTSGDMQALRALMARNATICYRDNRGRKLFGIITALPESDIPQIGYSTTLDMTENAFSEVV